MNRLNFYCFSFWASRHSFFQNFDKIFTSFVLCCWFFKGACLGPAKNNK